LLSTVCSRFWVSKSGFLRRDTKSDPGHSYFEENKIAYIPTNTNARLVGLCTGLITATAVASANSLTALLPLAIESIRIAFRTGAHVGRTAQQLECQAGRQSWSSIVNADEKTAQAALDKFQNENIISPSNRLWISASSASSVTISGPPSVLKRFFNSSDAFARHVDVTIFAPYHASHLHTDADIEKILRPQSRTIFGAAKTYYPVCSSVTGKPLEGESALAVLETALQEILLEPLRWDRVLKYCSSAKAKEAQVFAVGPTNLASSVVSALKASVSQVTLEDSNTWISRPVPGSVLKKDARIAIVGMAGRFPDAASHELFWDLLEKGLDVHRPVPADRYPVESHTDPTSKKKNTSHTPFGNFIENPGLFDARFFNMSPREAAQTDPMQRLMLVTAYEAMEMGGIVPGRTPSTKHDRIGTFYGQTSDDWREINAAQDIDTYFISGGVRAFGPGRLNYFFKWSGPSFSVDTACSSSFAALNIAITALRAGECDTAFSGGANVLTNPDIFSGLSRGHFLSKTGSCKTFDNEADGYCRGDGVASIILKRYDDAIADKDPILGIILGTGTNHSAEAVSITHPCAENQAFLFDKVLKEAAVDARDVNYVEMHGTGTQAGDGIEMESVSSVFAPRERKRRPDQPLFLGAVKSNIGHGEAVSGVSALVKVLMMLQKSAIPPHTGIKNVMNKNFPKDLAERGVNIAFKKTPFLRPKGGKRIVFINNFSAAGGNTALLLEDGPEKAPKTTPDLRSTQVVAVSAKSLAAFKKTLQRLQNYVDANEIDLADLAYTTTARRSHYNYRAAFPVSSTSQLSSALKAIQSETHNPIPLVAPQMAFAYTGQGSQYTAMGKKLFETSKQFRNDVTEFNEIAQRQGLPSFMALVDGSVEVQNLPPTVVQLGMCCIQMALTRLWATWGIKPSVVIGHSLGEYAALEAAGVLSVSDTIYLVGKRAALLEEMCTAGTHAMLAVRSPLAALQDVVANSQGKIEVACINGLADTVLSGTMADIDAVAEKLAGQGQKCTKLKLPFAFHSSQVDAILPTFEKLAAAVTYHAPKVPVISPLLSDIIGEGGVIDGVYLSRHCRKTVDYVGGLSSAMARGTISNTSVWVEVGGHPLCASMIKSTLAAPTLATMRRDEDPWKVISTSMSALYTAGLQLNWTAFHQESDGLSVLNIPTYGFDEKVYWLQYTGDWTLTKNTPAVAPAKAIAEAPKPKTQLTSSVQYILSEKVDGKKATVVAETDIGDPHIHKVISGHLINGGGLCPSSLYADMAYTIIEYAYKLLKPDGKPDLNLGEMVVPAPLILKNIHAPEQQLVQIETTVDLTFSRATFSVSTTNGGKKTIQCQCVVNIEDSKQWDEQWHRTAFMVQDRIKMLKQKEENGEADKMGRPMAYKLFKALVDYGEKFQGMKTVTLDGEEFEATATIKFNAGPQDGTFNQSPYYIDSVAHISGFIVNSQCDPNKECFISHGWQSMRIAEKLDPAKTYRSYVKMQPVAGSKGVVAGDVYVFNSENKVIGLVGGLKFQRLPRAILNTFMKQPGKAAAPAKTTAPAPAISKTVPAKSPVKKPTAIEIPKAKPPKKAAAPKAPKAPKVKAPAASNMVTKCFDIIAQEIDCDQSELNDGVQWADLGVDSLLSLTISGRLREDLDLEIESTLFTEFASVGALKKHLASTTSSGPSETNSSESGSESDEELESGITTPDSEEFDLKPQTQEVPRTAVKPAQSVPATQSDDGDLIAIIRQTIAEEMEIDIEEITESTDLSTLGMDSLMSLTILGALREKCDIELESTILADNPSLGHLRKALNLTKPELPPPQAQTSTVRETVPVVKELPPVDIVAQMPPASSVLLQGNPKTASRNLFLFPDGSGSATSYVSIPAIDSKNLAVYGLNCPFMKDPTSYTCGIVGVSKLYLEEVMRRQPIGPYTIGGWSAGGVVAYEVTRQLAELAKTNPGKNWYVERLILIDAPCPIALEPLPSRLHHFFDEIGLLGTGTGKTPSWLLPHFEYSIKALQEYEPILMKDKPFKAPSTLLIWARDGVCKNPDDPRPPPQDDDPKSMKWLLENRTDFGTNGWERLLGEENCAMVSIDGNHFSMMKPPVVSRLTPIVQFELDANNITG
jgi:iterative type I PKS product template protein